MKPLNNLIFLCVMLIFASCASDDDSICDEFSLATCDVSDQLELDILEATFLDQTSPFYSIQLSQQSRTLLSTSIYESTMQFCEFELDTNASNRLLELNASTHFWCTDLINIDNVITKEELDCLFDRNIGVNNHQTKYPNTRVFSFSRPIVDKFGRAYILFDDGCESYNAVLEFNQGRWEVICGGPFAIC